MRGKDFDINKVNSGIWFFISILILNTFVNNKNIVILSTLILTFCDSISGISYVINTHFKIKLAKKIIIKYFVFIIVGIIIINIYYNNYLINIYSCNKIILYISLFCSALTELIANKIDIDDNFLVPISFAIFYNIISYL